MNFTLIHWLVALVFVVLFVLVIVLIKDQEKQTQLVAGTISALLLLLFGTGAMFVLDSFIKVGELSSIATTRLYNQEKMEFRGSVANSGNFDIKTCSLKITIHNSIDTATLSALKASMDKSFGEDAPLLERIRNFFNGQKKGDTIPMEIIHEEEIAHDLPVGDAQGFVISLPLQSGVSSTKIDYELTCH